MRRSLHRHTSVLLFALACSLLASGAMAQLQTQVDSQVQMGTALFDQIELGNNVVSLSRPESSQEELPGLGHKFELIGGMVDDNDPQNPTNNTISVDTTGGIIGIAFRNLPPGIKITALDTQLGLKALYVAPRTCGGGSPRITLLVDSDGDGSFNFAAHGHVNPPTFTACPPDWTYENLTDNLKRWETTPATILTPPCGPVGGPTTCTWDELEMRIMAQFPNHKILAGFLLDGESCAFFLAACGKAHYDLVTIENRTLENKQDTV